ncbi:MAG: acyl-CoA desaturase [bacterium]
MGARLASLSGFELTEKLRSDLPAEAFKPRFKRGLLLFPLLAAIFGLSAAIFTLSLPWYGLLGLSLLLGMTYGSLSFLGHETLHGSTFKAKWAQDLVGYCAFFIYCFTPTLWRVWHNQVHHVNTNVPDIDPDSYGTLHRFRKIPLAKFQFKTGVGSGNILSAFFYFYRFTYHSQIVLWLISRKYPKEFRKLNRRRATLESLGIMAFWVALGVWAGWKGALFGIVIPMALANAILMSYISTNHFLRPLTTIDEPVDHSMSVTSPRWVDFIHLNFSYHVEHHYFPTMSPRFAPLVRRSLQKHAPDRYLAPPHWKAILWLYRTPRLYEDAETLINPYTGKRVKIRNVEEKLRT